MALFFDHAWFDAQLSERGLSRTVMAAAAGMSEADLALVFKDQRELSAREVTVFAELLGVAPAEIARHAGRRLRRRQRRNGGPWSQGCRVASWRVPAVVRAADPSTTGEPRRGAAGRRPGVTVTLYEIVQPIAVRERF